MSEKRTETPQDISKKELLLETGISYGQLYRWKREGLIPEDWFEKRSSFTGQETFFPRRLVLERVEAIQSMKDGLSLSEIRDLLNAVPRQTDLRQTLLETGSMDADFIDSLAVELEGIWLSELSLKAVTNLSLALDKAAAAAEDRCALVSQVIKALSVEVPAILDAVQEDEQQEKGKASEEVVQQLKEAASEEAANEAADSEQSDAQETDSAEQDAAEKADSAKADTKEEEG